MNGDNEYNPQQNFNHIAFSAGSLSHVGGKHSLVGNMRKSFGSVRGGGPLSVSNRKSKKQLKFAFFKAPLPKSGSRRLSINSLGMAPREP